MLKETNVFMLNALGLPIITNLENLSNKLGLGKKLIYIFSQRTNIFYRKMNVLKKNGDKREILVPSYSLKIVQKWILKNILEKVVTSDESMAFKKGENFGIKANAERHKYSLHILKLDFENFFTSIKIKKVFLIFKKIGYNNFISEILSNICTYNGYLPQGAVTSPYLSNLVCYDFDNVIKDICEKKDIIYTRYADDLIFSCDNIVDLRNLEKEIKNISKRNGFTINREKTKYRSPNRKKTITGITINEGQIKANKKMKRKLRSIIYNSIKNRDSNNIDIINGYIAFINNIEPGYKTKIIKYLKNIVEKSRFRTLNIKVISEYAILMNSIESKTKTTEYIKCLVTIGLFEPLKQIEFYDYEMYNDYDNYDDYDVYTYQGK